MAGDGFLSATLKRAMASEMQIHTGPLSSPRRYSLCSEKSHRNALRDAGNITLCQLRKKTNLQKRIRVEWPDVCLHGMVILGLNLFFVRATEAQPLGEWEITDSHLLVCALIHICVVYIQSALREWYTYTKKINFKLQTFSSLLPYLFET